DLWFNQSIELVLFRNQLIDRRVSFILNLHQATKELAEKAIEIEETLNIAETIQKLNLNPSRIDIGKLALEVRKHAVQEEDLADFLANELAGAQQHQSFAPRDVVLYGFGRIGRLLARELISKAAAGRQLRLRAIVTRDQTEQKTLEKRAGLLRQDSIHGDFEGEVDIDVARGALIIKGVPVYLISAKNPE